MSSVPSSSRPSSPTKPGVSLHAALKPNPHPYAIKTTSTGILSRSATTSSSVSHSHNHYVPHSPSPSPTKATHAGHEERGSRHRYSRSLTDEIPRPLPAPPEEVYFQQQHGHGHTRSRAETLPPHIPDPSANPKTWTFEQLAENVPEIAAFVRENEITGRAFLRFDEGVLDAYGVTQQWQRSLLLSASRRLRQSVLRDRIWPDSNPMTSDFDGPTGRLSHSHSLSDSPTKSHPLTLPTGEDGDEDQAYLSSSSISSTTSLSGRRKRRYRPNGRVHGMVESFERSSSVDEGLNRRERSGSISSVESSDEPHFYQHPQGSGGRPLPYPPHPGDAARGPLLLPTSSFPESLSSPFNTPHATGNGNGNGNGQAYTTPQVTGNGGTATANGQRPLPSLPPHPSLRSSPFEADHTDFPAQKDVRGDVFGKNTSGAMTMDEFLDMLDADAAAEGAALPAPAPAPVLAPALTHGHAHVNTDRRREKERDRKKERGRPLTGAAAWEMDFGLGVTVKRAPPVPAPGPAAAAAKEGEEMSVEELLALEGGGVPVGVAAWVDGPEGVGRTMKRVEEPEEGAGGGGGLGKLGNERFGSVSKATGKGVDRISLSAGRRTQGMGKKQVRRVGEVFTLGGGVEERAAGEGVNEKENDAVREAEEGEELELERMREVERRLLKAEEEERERWSRQAEKERDEARRRLEEEERVRLQEEERRTHAREAEARRHRAEEEERQLRLRAEEEAEERRKQEEREQQLASSLEETRRLLDVFRGRLEEVERRVGEMEDAASASSVQADTTAAEAPKPKGGTTGKESGTQACVVRRFRALAAWALSTSLGSALLPIVGVPLTEFASSQDATQDRPATTNDASTGTSPAPPAHRRRDRAARIRDLYPATLPKYALLIGIGMCAFVLRGLMRCGVRSVRGMGMVGARGVRGR